MAQIFGIIGFFLSMLAIFIASEMMRRANQRILHAETAVYKLSGRINKLEAQLAEGVHNTQMTPAQIKRQKETLIALEKKTRQQRADTPTTGNAGIRQNADNARFVPSQFKKTTG